MRYSIVSAAILALASSVFAQASTDGFDVITSPTEGQKVVAGSSFDITWVPGDKPEYQNGTATIVLLQGSTQQDLQIGDTIVAGVKNSAGKHTWKVPSNPGSSAVYGLRITLDDDKTTAAKEDSIFQYSFPFQIVAAASSDGPATTTIILGTGTAYTPEPTTTSTRILTVTNTTLSVSTTTSASLLPTNSSNFTLTATSSGTSTRSTRVPTTTSAVAPSQTGNSGTANAVSGGLMLLGGAVVALLL